MDYPSMENIQQRQSIGEFVCPKCENAFMDLERRPEYPHEEKYVTCPKCEAELIVFYPSPDYPDRFFTILVTPEYQEYCRQLDLFWSGF